jgi:phenylpyruvate tautomerase PptA (4-oxalocrotonate tautomerase family)
VTFGIRAAVFDRPDADDVLGRLAAGVTDAVAAVVGERVRPGITVEFVGTPAGRTGVGGALASHQQAVTGMLTPASTRPETT